VRLALRNLLRNAFEHGGPDVHVTLRIEEQESPAAMVLTVADDGPGHSGTAIDDEPAPLVQGASGAQRRGLGLVIVRRVMAMHHGQLVMVPNAPQGLQARLIFPDPSETVAYPTGPAAAAATEPGTP
jgi:signal transduction histidine kinase